MENTSVNEFPNSRGNAGNTESNTVGGHKGDLRTCPIQSVKLEMRSKTLRFREVSEPFKVSQHLRQSWAHSLDSLAV